MQKLIVFTLSILVSTLLPIPAMFVGEGANGDEEEDEHLSLQTHHHCPPKIPEFIRNVGPKGRLDFAKLFVNNLNTTKVTLYEKMKEWADEYDVRSEFDKFVVKHEERKDFFHELLSKNLAGDALELYGKIWDAQHDKEISFIAEHKQIAQAFNESKPDIRRMVKILVRPMLPCLRFPKSWRQSGSSSASSSSSSASSAENGPKEGQRIPAPSQFHPRMGQINNGNASPPRLQAVPIPVHYGAGGQQQLNGNDRRFVNGNSIDDSPAPRRYGSDSDYRIVAQPSSHRNPFTQNGNEEAPIAIQPTAQRPKNPPPNGLATAENSMSKNNKQDTDFVISDSQTEQ